MWSRERQRYWVRNNQNYLEHSNLCRGRAVIWKNAANHETAFMAFTVLIQAAIQAIMWVRRKSSKRKVLLSFVVLLYNFLKIHFYLKCVSINIRPGRLVQKKEFRLRKAENRKNESLPLKTHDSNRDLVLLSANEFKIFWTLSLFTEN